MIAAASIGGSDAVRAARRSSRRRRNARRRRGSDVAVRGAVRPTRQTWRSSCSNGRERQPSCPRTVLAWPRSLESAECRLVNAQRGTGQPLPRPGRERHAHLDREQRGRKTARSSATSPRFTWPQSAAAEVAPAAAGCWRGHRRRGVRGFTPLTLPWPPIGPTASGPVPHQRGTQSDRRVERRGRRPSTTAPKCDDPAVLAELVSLTGARSRRESRHDGLTRPRRAVHVERGLRDLAHDVGSHAGHRRLRRVSCAADHGARDRTRANPRAWRLLRPSRIDEDHGHMSAGYGTLLQVINLLAA